MNDCVVLGGVPRPVNDGAEARGIAFELLQIIAEVGDCVLLDLCGPLPQFFPLGDRMGALVTLRPNEPERLVVPMGVRLVDDEGGGGGGVIESCD